MRGVQVVALSMFAVSCAALIANEPSAVQKNNSTAKNSPLAVEGGSIPTSGTTHQGREHVTNEPASKKEPIIEKPSVNATTEAKHDNSTISVDFGKAANKNLDLPKDDNKTSVPKKGVGELPVSSSEAPVHFSSQKPSTSSQKPMKPRITESDDVVPEEVDEKEPAPRLPNIDSTLEKRIKRSDYVVPIVGVILSVPLVAILISLVYKKGADWWQHRNYRRMDYLIEGIYNN